MLKKPVLLIILDGFGHRDDEDHNAIKNAKMPHWNRLWDKYAHSFINASEEFVGLPKGQMGNSEVGHLNIGAGRIVQQDLERINTSITSGDFFKTPSLISAFKSLKANGKALHLLGLFSDGGVHSHLDHFYAMLKIAKQCELKNVYIHPFLDGRDTPPKSALHFIEQLESHLKDIGVGKIASISGRYYAMDRDKRWPRVELAYNALTLGSPIHSKNAADAIHEGYERNETDEFIKPTSIHDENEKAITIQDNDAVVFMNYRSDRARQITDALLQDNFNAFERQKKIKISDYFTLTQYDPNDKKSSVIFKQISVNNSFGEYISKLGLKQLRIAETEKYPHVTFFFNGGNETVYEGEDRILVPSPQVATYDLQPEMSAFEVAQKLGYAIQSKKYHAIICNFANADMVGHTGNLNAAIKAMEVLDTCIGKVVIAMESIGGEVIITADHGNAELMEDYENKQVHTQHTTNVVPFLYIGRKATIKPNGRLSDIAPTLLHLMGEKQPSEMTGQNLIQLND
ncbi:2,3-bisphosphoglycerate-independent phosphoglycerate mutase [Candidatus Methylopumilus planktonicus]|uniref:2,3-bisphosphoglycerate-independent phosphoglycerate mutase n=1 Tax=Candidatus Methylopumilus planktonicus TaxID=1581557 RepID=UPI0011207329|nr:2,3-bisphosphoglycerate-independent phosphoglycerate mutase [Candidatus Methylopumilus planktonicus]QDD11527.1 2,3-bisphosphoglycerate-independent phosphoglycerate mutase [Candidatus Methylopumilus planktonicus]QDD23998.1 2,3-bisphosphoglycerate-independent phosphoglycerate mutase [Candidatus Methylopumilus planktonicus]